MERASDILQSLAVVKAARKKPLSGALLPFTAAQVKLAEAATEIVQNPADSTATAFMARQLVLCTLPHADPGDVSAWTRTNGNFAFGIQPGIDAFTGKSVGIPYGTIPRLLLFWLTTEAVRTRSPVFELGDTLADFMRELGLDPSRGGKRSDAHRLKEQAARLFSASITFQHKFPASRMDMKIGRSQLWWSPKTPDQAALWGSRIELSAEFFKAILKAPVPVDTRALHALKRSPLALDLYSLLTYTAFVASNSQTEQVFTLQDLRKQFGADYDDPGNFRKKVHAALRKIGSVLPKVHIEMRPGAFVVLPSSQPAISPKKSQ